MCLNTKFNGGCTLGYRSFHLTKIILIVTVLPLFNFISTKLQLCQFNLQISVRKIFWAM